MINLDKKIQLKPIVLLVLFVISMIASPLYGIWLVAITVFLPATYKIRGAIEAFILIQIRGLLSTGVAAEKAPYTTVKWVCIFLLSLYIILYCLPKIKKRYAVISIWLFAFLAYLIVTAIGVSSYPLVSIAKAVSYVIPFLAILWGIGQTKDVDWISYINKTFGFVLISSAALLPLPVGYLVNGAFQGALNHPNMYGIMLAVYLAGYLYKRTDKIQVQDFFIVALVFFLIIKSESRTGLFSAATVLIIYFLFSKIDLATKIIIIIFGIIMFVISLNFPVLDFITDFIYKGHDDSIFHSRESVIDRNIIRIKASPFFGTGFNVPYVKGMRSYDFSFDLMVENGNLFLAILGDIGIFGLLIFVFCYGYIFIHGDKKNLFLFVVPIMVSMGEMVFFSTNNCAIILYIYFGVYFAEERKVKKEKLVI